MSDIPKFFNQSWDHRDEETKKCKRRLKSVKKQIFVFF